MTIPTQNQIHSSRPTPDTLLLTMAGNWRLQQGIPTFSEIEKEIHTNPSIRRLTFDSQQVTNWDSGLVTFLLRVLVYCSQHHIEVDQTSLPEGVQRLLSLATSVPERQGARRRDARDPWLDRLGEKNHVEPCRSEGYDHVYR